MSGIELHPVEGGDAIDIPFNKTTIGRGPFLQVQDKRVSRNHATLEVDEEGNLVLTPIHTNPCFLKPHDGGTQMTLTKDKCKILEHGDVVGLLPDKLFYKVVYVKQLKKEKTTAGVKIEDESKDKAEMKNGQNDDSDEEEAEDEEESPEEEKPSVKEKAKKTVKAAKKEMALPLDKSRTLPKWMVGAGKRVCLGSPKKDEKSKVPSKPRVATNAHPPAAAKGRARKQEVQEEEDEEEDDYEPEEKVPPKKVRGAPKARKRKASDSEELDEEVQPKRSKATRKRGRRVHEEEEEDEDYEEDAGRRQTTRRPRAASQKAKYKDDYGAIEALSEFSELSSEEEEELPSGRSRSKGEDSDFVMSASESGSDWELSVAQSSRKSKGRSKAVSPRRKHGRATKGTRKSKRGRRKQKQSDDEDEEEEEDSYVPRPTRRRAGTKRSSRKVTEEEEDEEEEEEETPPRKRRAASRKPAKSYVDEEEEDEEEKEEEEEEEEDYSKKRRKNKAEENNDKKKKKKRRADSEEEEDHRKNKKKKQLVDSDDEEEEEDHRTKKKKKQLVDSDDEEEEEDHRTKKKKKQLVDSDDEEEEEEHDDDADADEEKQKKTKRQSCWFGKKCYRKNPDHHTEYCHPGESSFDEDEVRQSLSQSHLRKGTRKVIQNRPKREKDKKSVLHNASDDDGCANTYDYQDSFLQNDDDEQSGDGSSSYLDPADSDDDYEPDDSENVRNLVKEAKGFVRNKKMQKPARSK